MLEPLRNPANWDNCRKAAVLILSGMSIAAEARRGPFARVGDLEPTEATRSPELGRSPFWERPSRALLDPEDLSGE
jgi:hypothetical protein